MYTTENTFKFDKNTTTLLKGIAIILMIIHHFFGFPKWIIAPNCYIPIGLTINNLPLEQVIATFNKICVGLFLFVTGYGMFFSYNKNNYYRKSFKKLIKFLSNYWIIMILLFIPIKIYLGKFNFNLKDIFLNMFAYKTSYITFAWYVRFYIEIIIFFPLLKKLIKNNCYYSIFISIIPFNIINYLIIKQGYSSLIPINFVYEFFYWVPILMLGYIFAKFNIFQYIKHKFIHLDLDNIYIYFFLCLLIFAFRTKFKLISGTNIDILCVPFFIFSIINITSIINYSVVNRTLILLGKHSLNIWFLHNIFFIGNSKIQSIAYYPKLPILIIIWVFVLVLPLSYIINSILIQLENLFIKIVSVKKLTDR
ncbi:hypothetical protein DIC82_02460 [Clostridium beijerinckii]|nr:hypothetical protein DIC82_02460 [Clostridium beijerinckii]